MNGRTYADKAPQVEQVGRTKVRLRRETLLRTGPDECPDQLGLAKGALLGIGKMAGRNLPSRFGQIRQGILKSRELSKSRHNLKLSDGKRIDLKGQHPLSKGHFNKVTQERFGYPHVVDPAYPGGVRAPIADDFIEIFNLYK